MNLLAQQDIKDVFGEVRPPSQLSGLGSGAQGINTILANMITYIFMIAGVVFVFMVFFSALQMIMSGGDKETLARARGRLTWAIIGIVILALSFVFFRVLGYLTGFDVLLF